MWALQNSNSLVVGGKTNRAKVEFELQLSKILLFGEDNVNMVLRKMQAKGKFFK